MALLSTKSAAPAKVGAIGDLIAKKNYAKAIEVIKEQLKAGKHNPQLHIQLADILVLAKKTKEAIQILMRVADDFAKEGFEAKAIAVLKKVDKLEPGRSDVQQKLQSFVRDKRPAAPATSAPPVFGMEAGGGLELGVEEIGMEASPVSAPEPPSRRSEPEPVVVAPPAPAPEIDLGDQTIPAGLDLPPIPRRVDPAPVEDLDFGGDEEESGLPLIELEPAAVEVDDIQLEPDAEPELEATAAPGDGDLAFDDQFAAELMGAIDDAFAAPAAPETPPTGAHRHGAVRGDFMRSPLFQGFSPDELVAILEGLTLHTFEAGDIILSQGAPGHSLFILSTGIVKAWVKEDGGAYRFVKDLVEGSFFGEFAIVTGQPRAATVTAATHCELLELDRGTIDAISISHPHVTEVLQQFYEKRKKGK
jgi:hypothetical protein